MSILVAIWPDSTTPFCEQNLHLNFYLSAPLTERDIAASAEVPEHEKGEEQP